MCVCVPRERKWYVVCAWKQEIKRYAASVSVIWIARNNSDSSSGRPSSSYNVVVWCKLNQEMKCHGYTHGYIICILIFILNTTQQDMHISAYQTCKNTRNTDRLTHLLHYCSVLEVHSNQQAWLKRVDIKLIITSCEPQKAGRKSETVVENTDSVLELLQIWSHAIMSASLVNHFG